MNKSLWLYCFALKWQKSGL